MPEDQDFVDNAFSVQEQDLGAETIEFTPAEDAPTDGPSAEERLAAAEDRNLRLQAELQNVMGRTRRELDETRRYAAIGVARDLLPALDNIDRALEAAKAAGDAGPAGLADGFRMVRDQIATALAQHGCELIETAPGTPFDPALHQAILQQPSAEVPEGAILFTAQTGYKLHDRVVRAAQVIVSSGPGAS